MNYARSFGVGFEGSDEERPWMLDDDVHLDLLEKTVAEHEATLCLIDPLADFTGKLNLNDGGDVGRSQVPSMGLRKELRLRF